MPTTPDTGAYLLLGLVVVFSILGLYLSSLALRFRNSMQTLATLDQLENE